SRRRLGTQPIGRAAEVVGVVDAAGTVAARPQRHDLPFPFPFAPHAHAADCRASELTTRVGSSLYAIVSPRVPWASAQASSLAGTIGSQSVRAARAVAARHSLIAATTSKPF